MAQGNQQDLPPYVRFETKAVEDRTQQLAQGRYGFKDVDFAHITRPGSRDTVVKEALVWLADVERGAQDGRVPVEWPRAFRAGYEAWKKGQELPVQGTPIKGWGGATPAQQETLVALGVRVVEELAAAPEEVCQRIGIGALTLKQKAQAWLLAAKDQGAVSEQVATLLRDNEALRRQLDELLASVAELKARQTEPAPL